MHTMFCQIHFPFPSAFALSGLQGSCYDLFYWPDIYAHFLHTDIFQWIIWSSNFLVVIVSEKLLSMYSFQQADVKTLFE